VESFRINRYLARCGLGSRRAVEELVLAGRVRVNDAPGSDLSLRVDPANDRVTLDGKPLELAEVGRVLLLHKPVGVVSSLVRQDARPCLLDVLPERERSRRLFHVGRLDHDSSGLLLLSDDGDLAQGLLHPSHQVWKCYRVRVRPSLVASAIERMANGSLELDGRALAPARIRELGSGLAQSVLEIDLREGRNRQLRRMVELVGGRVLDLHRTAFGPILLGDLAPGATREATPDEYRRLHALVSAQR